MDSWQNILVQPDTPILSVVKIIDKSALQIALVVDADRKLIGTVTDGDIRRALLSAIDLQTPVSKIMNTHPTVAYADEERMNIKAMMKRQHVNHIPLVNEKRQVIGLEIASQMLDIEKRDNLVVLMAGGRGERLKPLTENCPKPLLKVGGKPILETILNNFIEYGFYNFCISVHYRSEMVEDYFGDGSKWGINIRYIKEKKRLGTAGALGLLDENPEKPLIVMNGDLLTKVNFECLLNFHNSTYAAATMCLREYTFQIPFGVAVTEEHRLIRITEKPVEKFFVSAGIYVINPEVLRYIPKNSPMDMPNLFQGLVNDNREVAAFPIREYWLDIGRMGDFEKANSEFPEVFG